MDAGIAAEAAKAVALAQPGEVAAVLEPFRDYIAAGEADEVIGQVSAAMEQGGA